MVCADARAIQRVATPCVNAPRAVLSVFYQGLWSVFTQGSLLVCGVGTSIILNRVLQPEGRGALAMVMFWPPLLARLSLSGWERANEWHVSRHPEDARGAWSSTMSAGLGSALVLIGAGAWILPKLQFPNQPELHLPLILMLLNIPIYNIQVANTSVLEGAGLYNWTAILRLGNHILLLAAMVGLAMLDGLTIVSYISSVIAMSAVICVLGFAFVVYHTEGSWYPRMLKRTSYIVRVAPYVWIQAFMSRIDLMLILALLPWAPTDVGIFVASSAIATLLQPATTGVSMVLVPASANRSATDAIVLLERSLRYYLLVSIPFVAVLCFLAAPILTIAFGEEYSAGVWIMRISVCGEAVFGCLRIGGAYLQGRGKAGTSTAIQILMFATTILCGIAFVSGFGCIGAVLARACGAVVGLIVFMRICQEVRPIAILPRLEDVRDLVRRFAVAPIRT